MKKALRKTATSLLLIVLVALGTRAAFAWHHGRQFSPHVLSVVAFQNEAGHIAYSIASGKGFSSPFQRDSGPTAWLAPVYPYLLAGIFKLFGVYTLKSFFVAVLLNIVFSTAACIPIFHAGERVAGAGVGAAAAWLWALFPNAILIPFEWVWDTSLSALLVAALLWATLQLAESQKFRDWCLYGALCGLAILTNPAIGLLLPVFLLWAAHRACVRDRTNANRASMSIARLALSVAVAVACCAPWMIRNYVKFHKLIPVRSNLAFELYVGNNENYDEKYRFRPGPVTQDREILRYLHMGETAFMEEEKRKALSFIWAHPRVEAWLIEQRFVDFWMGTAIPFATFRQADTLWLRFILVCNYAAPLCALLGVIVLIATKNEYAVPLVSVPLIFPLLYYVTHTSLRYRHPIDPIVLLLAAIGVQGICAKFARRFREQGEAQPVTN